MASLLLLRETLIHKKWICKGIIHKKWVLISPLFRHTYFSREM
jgi:hypothetical protein